MINKNLIQAVIYNLEVDRRIEFNQAEKKSTLLQTKGTDRKRKTRDQVDYSIMCIKRAMDNKVEMKVWSQTLKGL